jgi:hypothetical protein
MDGELNCKFVRRFGVEIELNTRDGKIKRLEHGDVPDGSIYIANLINKITKDAVQVCKWHYTHNNENWVIKADSSCGLEICSPVLKGRHGLEKLLSLIKVFGEDEEIKADKRCSLHVHINVSDLSDEQLASVIAYWIKCEYFIFSAFPDHRKNSRYCQFIGMSDLFEHDINYSPQELIYKMSHVKYNSLNTYHLYKKRRKAIEFRIAENDFCLNPFLAKNWILFLLHFVEMAKFTPNPPSYSSGNSWSSLLWFDSEDAIEFLRFNTRMSKDLAEVRDWFLTRCEFNGYNTSLPGVWSNKAREIDYFTVRRFIDERNIKNNSGLQNLKSIFPE